MRAARVDVGTAQGHAFAVMSALRQAVGEEDFADVLAELPRDYAPILPGAPEVTPAHAFVARVAETAGIDEARARRATEAVLETLAERISAGEVRDLIARLPAELRDALRRGTERTGGDATRMSLDEFLRRIARREGGNPAAAREHARAVFAALPQEVSDEEFFDVVSQLPTDYGGLLVGSPR